MEPADWYISPEEYAIAAKNGIKKDTLEHRIRYYGWNKEKAITKKIVRCKLGKWIELAAKNGIPRETFTEKTWDQLDSLKKGREKQKTLKLGPYKAINSFWKLIKSE